MKVGQFGYKVKFLPFFLYLKKKYSIFTSIVPLDVYKSIRYLFFHHSMTRFCFLYSRSVICVSHYYCIFWIFFCCANSLEIYNSSTCKCYGGQLLVYIIFLYIFWQEIFVYGINIFLYEARTLSRGCSRLVNMCFLSSHVHFFIFSSQEFEKLFCTY